MGVLERGCPGWGLGLALRPRPTVVGAWFAEWDVKGRPMRPHGTRLRGTPAPAGKAGEVLRRGVWARRVPEGAQAAHGKDWGQSATVTQVGHGASLFRAAHVHK